MNRFRRIKFQLSGDSIPKSLKWIELQLSVGGQVVRDSFPPDTGLTYEFLWNGKDAWGRPMQESHANIRVNYVYDGIYKRVDRFGYNGTGYIIGADRTTNVIKLGQDTAMHIKGLSAQSWAESAHQTLNPSSSIVDLGGGGVQRAPDIFGGTKTRTVITHPYTSTPDVRIAPDSTIWVATEYSHVILQYSKTGDLLRTVDCYTCSVEGLAFLSNGSVLVAQGQGMYHGQGVLDINPANNRIGVFSEYPNELTWRVDVNHRDDVLIAYPYQGKVTREATSVGRVTVAGGGSNSPMDDGVLATTVSLTPWVAVWTSDTDFIVGSQGYIHRVDGQGRIWRLAGDGTMASTGDGGAARDARVMKPSNIALVGTDVCFTDGGANVIRCISTDGLIRTVAGTGVAGNGMDGEDATKSELNYPTGLSVGPDGWVYFSDLKNQKIRKLKVSNHFAYPSQRWVPDRQSGDVWIFDSRGRHVQTRSSSTGDTLRTFLYDSQGRTTKICNRTDTTKIEYPTGATIRYIGTAGANGQPRVTTVNKDASGNVVSIIQPNGKIHAFTYQSGGLLESYQKPNGRISHFKYDVTGSLVSDADGDTPAQLISETTAGDTTHLIHRNAAGAITEYIQNKTADATNRHQVVNGAVGPFQTKYANGDQSIVESDGTVASTSAVPDPQWGMARPLYDELRKLPNGDSVKIRRRAWDTLSDPSNPLSLLRRVDTTQVGAATYLRDWNPQTRVLQKTNPTGVVTRSRYDARERLVQQAYQEHDTLNITYDDVHNMEVWSQQGKVTMVWKSRDGQVDSIRTNEGDTLRYVRDSDQQPTNVPQQGGSNVGLRWDDRGRLAGLTPANKSEHQFLYNSWGGEEAYLPPSLGDAQGQVRYAYDLNGRLERVTYSDQESILVSFDSQSRWSNLTFPEGNVSFQYQGNSSQFSQATRTFTNGTSQSLSDIVYGGEIYGETWTGQISGTVSRTKDLQGNLGVLSVAGQAIPYSWLLGGQIATAGDATYASSSQFGNQSVAELGNLHTSFTYDPLGLGLLSADTTKVGGTTIYSQNLTYDASGRISDKTERIGTDPAIHWQYGYTNGRLTSVMQNGVTIGSYGWDNNGNRVGSLVDAQDRLVTQGDASWTYDAMGHLKTRSDSRGAWTFTYDALWNLLSASGSQNISYVVDPRGRRVGRKVNGVLVQGFLYDGQLNPVAELDGSGATASIFVYGSRANVPDYMIKGGVNYRLVADHLGSVRLVVNSATGAVVSRIDYNVWGEITASQNLAFQPFGFAGGIRDDATGLVRFGLRDYDPHTGRWTGKDPIGFEGGLTNIYSYVGSDPVNFVDPTGLASESCKNDPNSSACYDECMDNHYAEYALVGMGLGFPGMSIPKLGRAAIISGGMEGSAMTSPLSLAYHWFPILGRGVRTFGRRINPVSNLVFAFSASYYLTSMADCGIQCQ